MVEMSEVTVGKNDPGCPVCSMLELLVGGRPKFPNAGVGLGRELSFSSIFPNALQKALNRPRLENEWEVSVSPQRCK